MASSTPEPSTIGRLLNTPNQRQHSSKGSSSSSSSDGNPSAGRSKGTPHHVPDYVTGDMTRNIAHDLPGRNTARWDAAMNFRSGGVVKGFGITDPGNIQFCLEQLLNRTNYTMSDSTDSCCLKHVSMRTVLITLRTMLKQRCDHSFSPFSYKQCTNCNLMAEEDEAYCHSCDSSEFRLARPPMMSL
eukprot:gnl/MRDRNA2_/MRDRNA2_308782_c0_seq1.p1 gnl/MRDRNA2_/MRDRNA2_308782_c0~~gnl/MRDRNA2_/MRDRNA2_308782_c0_seq1.p1  ORF type:complete len:186 (+),score=21.30 gnl/MRDRNA2_/MRDRNA2_308782_c0_seq1:481-1038(+)